MATRIVVFLLLCGYPLSSGAVEFYVAPSGNDSQPGTKEKPLRSLIGARDRVRQFIAQRPDEDVTVWLRGGTYVLTETAVFTLADSGSVRQTITYAAMPGETPVLSAGVLIKDRPRNN